jgi:hypothetical protein
VAIGGNSCAGDAGDIMFIGIGPDDIVTNFSGTILALGLAAMGLFLATVYLDEISAAVGRLSRYAIHLRWSR